MAYTLTEELAWAIEINSFRLGCYLIQFHMRCYVLSIIIYNCGIQCILCFIVEHVCGKVYICTLCKTVLILCNGNHFRFPQ